MNVSVDTTIPANTTDTNQQTINANDITLTVDGTLDFASPRTIDVGTFTGVTIINNAGATINSSDTGTTETIYANNGEGLTIINSGTISADGNRAIRIRNDTSFSIINNAGGLITSTSGTINLPANTGTITNSGTITTTGANDTIRTSGSVGTGVVITNNAGGIISNASTNSAIRLNGLDSIINSGSIINSSTGFSIRFDGNNNTATLKEGSILVGTIQLDAGTTGNTLKIEQGFGQAYFYEISGTGTFTLEDLSGNTAVKGSAGSVGQGANESVDELLGLRTFNLCSATKPMAAESISSILLSNTNSI